ncbi:MAG: WbqC family protein [Chthoniobacterales bacterium]
MKLAIMQPYLLPYIGYFQLMAAVDKFVIYDDVQFIKGGWINRNRILLGGREHAFTAPLLGASPNRLINEIELVQNTGWRRKVLRTIEQAYTGAAHYAEVLPLLSRIVSYPERQLTAYLLHSLEVLKTYLEIPASLINTSATYQNQDLKGQERILDICRREGASVYVNASGGRDLYRSEAFRAQGIALRFLDPEPFTYDQGTIHFSPSLSIVDVLMFNSRDEVKALLGKARLSQ